MQRVQQLILQPVLRTGVAHGCFREQAIALSQTTTCLELAKAHISSSSMSCRLQDCAHAADGSSRSLQSPASTQLAAAATAGAGCAHARWLQSQPSSWQQCRSVSTSSSSSSSKRPSPLVTQQQSARLAELDFKSVTVGQIMDQYTHPQGLYKEFIESGAYRSWEKFKGLMLKLGRNKYSNYLGNSMAKANIPGFSEEAMKQEAAAVYLRVQQAQAQMQADLIRDVVSKDVFIKLRAQTSQRRTQGWNDIHWEMLDQEQLDRNIQIVQKRAFKFFEQSKYDYLQFTLCISSKQRFAAYGSRGDLLAGDPQQVLDVTEYCVFERKTQARVKRQKASLTGLELSQPGDVAGSRWRLVGWLNP